MKAFIIYLPGHEHSESHARDYMFPTLKSYNIDVELFPGTFGNVAVEMAKKSKKTLYPYSIKSRRLSESEIERFIKPELYEEFKNKHHSIIYERGIFTEKDVGKLSRPGVLGTFYSHHRLWEKCVELNEPIMIFEDDVKFYRPYVPVEFDAGVLILSLGKSSFLGEPWRSYLENPSGQARAVPWRNFSMPGASGYIIKPDAARGLIKHYRPYWTTADNAIHGFVTTIEISTYLMGRNTLPEEGNISMAGYKGWRNNFQE